MARLSIFSSFCCTFLPPRFHAGEVYSHYCYNRFRNPFQILIFAGIHIPNGNRYGSSSHLSGIRICCGYSDNRITNRQTLDISSSIYRCNLRIAGFEGVVRSGIVGKPNVGKSSLINKLLGENRLIVSDIAGTTRDAVDTEITYNGKEYVFIDTAGLRRKNKIKEELERYMIVRTVSAVERAEVVVLMIDAEEGVTERARRLPAASLSAAASSRISRGFST